jgi:hypothetical protein
MQSFCPSPLQDIGTLNEVGCVSNCHYEVTSYAKLCILTFYSAMDQMVNSYCTTARVKFGGNQVVQYSEQTAAMPCKVFLIFCCN